MEYERIQKPPLSHQKQLSPGKLRAMIMGGGPEKKRRQEEEDEELSTSLSLRSQELDTEIHDSGVSVSEDCKDVDVVSVLTDYATSRKRDLYDGGVKDFSLSNSRIRSLDDGSLDYDDGIDSTSISSAMFEFQKGERFPVPQRVPLTPFSKPAPSKWDDAQKWIASPTSNRPKNVQCSQGIGSRKAAYLGPGSRQPSVKVVNEVPDKGLATNEEPDTKWIDSSHVVLEDNSVNWDAYSSASKFYDQQIQLSEHGAVESAINLSRHESSVSIHGSTAILPSASMARSVSMRDMGTEMTPIASQEPSRTGTPVRATTPTRSPTSSRPSTPGRTAPALSPIDTPNHPSDTNNNELSAKELQIRTRREIMALGNQLGKVNIAAWASKEDENREGFSVLKAVEVDQPSKSVIKARAEAWEEAEKAKYMARFKREEIKIQAWENHQKAKSEAEMRKIEVNVERMRSRAHEKLMNKLAEVQQKAEEKRAAAEAKKNRCAAKTETQADYIRRTGRLPSSFSCCHWCF